MMDTHDSSADVGSLFARTPDLDAEPEQLRAAIREYFTSTWSREESLFETLRGEDAYFRKPISLRHPLAFYLGHTATFYVNKLILTRFDITRMNERFESMFAVGVDEMSWDDLDERHYDWPSVAEIMAYRARVREAVLHIIDTAALESPIDQGSDWWAILMGIEHERIHLETSSVLIRQQTLSLVRPHPAWQPLADDGRAAPTNALVPVSAGHVGLGKPRNDRVYGWDNEYGVHEATVDAFAASRYLVSNGEYLAFVEAGGYADPAHWTPEGREWLAFSRAKHPEFWRDTPEGWHLRLLTQEVPMPWSWPVEVNCLEAEAFCAWRSARDGVPIRLPTEDEYARLRAVSGLPDRPPRVWPANIHLDHGASSCPVDRFQHGDHYDVAGNVWQWTATPIYPFDGFAVHPFYDDFSVPTFDGRHNLMVGGSWISCGNEAQASARYAFRRHFFQHAGFRYVSGATQPENTDGSTQRSVYETDGLVSQYLSFHFGPSAFGVPNFPRALVELLAPHIRPDKRHRAMDLGCAVGRASFELSRYFDEVVGVDFSARFIEQGVRLGRDGIVRYTQVVEGALTEACSASLAEMGLAGVRTPTFVQGDACNLKPTLTDFDLVLAANLIDRLYAPRRFLDAIHTRIRPDGLLVIASPYTWLEEHTPREHWLGGYTEGGVAVRTLDGLTRALGAHFTMEGSPTDVPFVIRETARKHQHTLSQVTLWRRRAT